jgi:putative phage-type endonuclease
MIQHPHLMDLPELKDLYDTLVIEDDFTNTHYHEDFLETIDIFIDDYVNAHILEYKNKDFEDSVKEGVYSQIAEIYKDQINYLDLTLDETIDECVYVYFIKNSCPRSYEESIILSTPIANVITRQLTKIQNKYQPDQRTDDWYHFRWNGLTASNLWKIFDSQASLNSLIYGKCVPINISKYKSVNIDSPFHNGHKYEPLSLMIYEELYDTKVSEYGCITHDNYDFLKASPDGINTKRGNPRYGRLVEVKNPVSRKLNGVPKKDYWIQMQHQMEVCDLNECDFLETIFKSYKSEDDFNNDGTFTKTADGKRKGIIIRFYDNNEPVYEYAPLNLTQNDFDVWYNETIEKNKNITWIENIYWYLEDISIVLITRNEKWYNMALPKMIETWDIIVKERKEGYDHRKPNKRVKKIKNNQEIPSSSTSIDFQHDVSNDFDISSDNFNFSYLNHKKEEKVIIKINTEKL